MSGTTSARTEPNLSVVATALMKGVVYRDTAPLVWQQLMALQPQVQDYVAVLGLVAIIDQGEGYAFLRSRPEPDEGSDEPAIPRLVARRSLSFPVSLLVALLRKKLAEADASSAESRLVLTRDQILDMLVVFLPTSSNEARSVDLVDTHIGKVVELGFLRKIGDNPPEYEVRRILKAFVDAQWLADFDARLAAYHASLSGEEGPDGDVEVGP
jgi:hypothetical protein